jgi:hypothetical protein
MRRIASSFTAPLFALLMAASLAFGVTTLFAQPAEPCEVNYFTGQVGAACNVTEDCTTPCRMVFPGTAGGACGGGCCFCAM